MFPPKGSGLEQIMKRLESNYPGFSLQKLAEDTVKRYTMRNSCNSSRSLNIPSPVQSLQRLQTSVQSVVNNLTQNLTSTISQITQRAPQEDYDAVVSGFLPVGARLVTPEYPSQSGEILLSDIDGDKQDEVIASYTHNDTALRTMVLKKQQDKWSRIAEIVNADSDGVHYRNTVDMAGNGSKQLLMGLFTKGKHRILQGYSINTCGAEKLFGQTYHKLEVLGLSKRKPASSKPYVALWNENDDETYNIDLLGWNGTELSNINTDRYYYKRVLPYLARTLRKQPNDTSNWYRMADALAKAGAKNDAMAVIEAGIKRDRGMEYAEKFQTLKNRL